ncbi:MAG: GyrI-like domain-containing protein [Spirochaetales bacterium]|nr:GyrI-like domain-containing protein [Spirochaetales bacterium]
MAAEKNKIDLKKALKELYNPGKKEPAFVTVPQMPFIMIDGEGNPNNSKLFEECCEVLYGLSYTLKFMAKQIKENPFDYIVMPLEGLWYADDPSVFLKEKKEKWKWTLMVMQPEQITPAMYVQAVEQLRKKKNPAMLGQERFDTYNEGLSVQIMYIGPYSKESPTIARLHQSARDNGYILHGPHHEIYLSDPRRSNPDNLKTIIRQPVR